MAHCSIPAIFSRCSWGQNVRITIWILPTLRPTPLSWFRICLMKKYIPPAPNANVTTLEIIKITNSGLRTMFISWLTPKSLPILDMRYTQYSLLLFHQTCLERNDVSRIHHTQHTSKDDGVCTLLSAGTDRTESQCLGLALLQRITLYRCGLVVSRSSLVAREARATLHKPALL